MRGDDDTWTAKANGYTNERHDQNMALTRKRRGSGGATAVQLAVQPYTRLPVFAREQAGGRLAAGLVTTASLAQRNGRACVVKLSQGRDARIST